MRRVIHRHRGGAVCRVKSDACGSVTDRSDVFPTTAVVSIQLSCRANDGIWASIQRIPRKDVRNSAQEISNVRCKRLPATNLFREAVPETHVVAVYPATLSTVFGVLLVYARFEK